MHEHNFSLSTCMELGCYKNPSTAFVDDQGQTALEQWQFLGQSKCSIV